MKAGSSKLSQSFGSLSVYFSRHRIALKCLDYQDKTLLTSAVAGPVALQLRLLSSLGYKCVPVGLDVLVQIQDLCLMPFASSLSRRFITMNSFKSRFPTIESSTSNVKSKKPLVRQAVSDHRTRLSLSLSSSQTKKNQDW